MQSSINTLYNSKIPLKTCISAPRDPSVELVHNLKLDILALDITNLFVFVVSELYSLIGLLLQPDWLLAGLMFTL